jgi:hypothetical protein
MFYELTGAALKREKEKKKLSALPCFVSKFYGKVKNCGVFFLSVLLMFYLAVTLEIVLYFRNKF